MPLGAFGAKSTKSDSLIGAVGAKGTEFKYSRRSGVGARWGYGVSGSALISIFLRAASSRSVQIFR
jgi:hypothetical protein